MDIVIRDALFEDCCHVAAHLRAADAAEVSESNPSSTPFNTVLDSWQVSDWCRVALLDGEPAVLWGVRQIDEQTGAPWLLATDRLQEVRREFVRQSREEVSKMLASYPRLYNFVHITNTLSQQWLQWLGFDLYDKPAGRNNNFYLFTSRGFFNV